MMENPKGFALAGAVLFVLATGAGCTTTKVRKELDERNRELRTVKEERDELKAGVEDLRTKERLYQEQLAALKSTTKAREASSPPEISGPRSDQRAKTIAGRLQGSGVEVESRAGRVVLTLPAAITFSSGQAKLTDRGRDALKKVGEALKAEHPTGRIWIEGHTDNEPIRKSPFKTNRLLSLARAEAVADFLKEKAGVPDRRLVLAGHGEWDPVADNKSGAGREKNRRVELVLED